MSVRTSPLSMKNRSASRSPANRRAPPVPRGLGSSTYRSGTPSRSPVPSTSRTPPAKNPQERMISSTPCPHNQSIISSRCGRLASGTIGLGIVEVMGRRRVPSPPARISACIVGKVQAHWAGGEETHPSRPRHSSKIWCRQGFDASDGSVMPRLGGISGKDATPLGQLRCLGCVGWAVACGRPRRTPCLTSVRPWLSLIVGWPTSNTRSATWCRSRSQRLRRRRLLTARLRRPPRRSSAQVWRTRRQPRSEEHTSELQSRQYLVCRLLLEKKNPQHGGRRAREGQTRSAPPDHGEGFGRLPLRRAEDRLPPSARRSAGAVRRYSTAARVSQK